MNKTTIVRLVAAGFLIMRVVALASLNQCTATGGGCTTDNCGPGPQKQGYTTYSGSGCTTVWDCGCS